MKHIVLILTLMSAFAIAACGKSGETPVPETAAPAAEQSAQSEPTAAEVEGEAQAAADAEDGQAAAADEAAEDEDKKAEAEAGKDGD